MSFVYGVIFIIILGLIIWGSSRPLDDDEIDDYLRDKGRKGRYED